MKPNNMAQRCGHSHLVDCSKCHIKPSPEIIMSGYLVKSPPLNKSILRRRWKTRYFVLRSDATLEYHESNKAVASLGVIDLQQTQRLEAGLETKKYANIFDLIMPGRTYFFSAGHLDIMFEWVSQIKQILGINEDVVYPQKTVSKPLNPRDNLLQYYVRELSREQQIAVQTIPPNPAQTDSYARQISADSDEERPVATYEIGFLNRDQAAFRDSLVRSHHYTVISRNPRTEVLDESISDMDTLGPQWHERNDSLNKIKEFIRSTSKGVIPSPPITKFYSSNELGSQSVPVYTAVHKSDEDTAKHFKRAKSLEESYDPTPPPIPPKFCPKSPCPESIDVLSIPDSGTRLSRHSKSVPDREGLLSGNVESDPDRQRLPSLGKIGKIKVTGSKEGVGKFSRPVALDPETQLSITDDSDVVCFGAIVKKVFGYHGGRITFQQSNIEVEVPRGAVSEEQIQGFYFKVSPDCGFVEEIQSDGIATHVCSPLVQFGPVGAKFDQPIRIKMPHCLNLSVDDYYVQLIFAYGDVFSSNGMNFLRIDASKRDFEWVMNSFNTIFGPVVFNLQPDHVVLEISHFKFQWVQLVALSRTPRPGRDLCLVSKRERLACFLTEPSGLKATLVLYLYNDYNDVFNKIVELEQQNHSKFLCQTETPFLLTNEDKLSTAHISVSDLEFGYKINGRSKHVMHVPAFGVTYGKSVFQLEKLFDNAKPFTCELQLYVEDKLVTSLDIESVDAEPKRVTQMKRDVTIPTRKHELAETLGLSMSVSTTFPLSLLSEAQRKYGCELEQVSETLKQLDAAHLLLSPTSPKQ